MVLDAGKPVAEVARDLVPRQATLALLIIAARRMTLRNCVIWGR
jgi:hypothetical protein